MRIPVQWDNDVLTIRQFLNFTANKYEDKPCIKYADENDEVISKSHRLMRDNSMAVSVFLKEKSAKPRHIALIAKTNYLYIVSMNGIMASGDVAIPMGFDLTVDQMVNILSDSDTEAVFYDDYTSERVAEAVKSLPKVKETYSLNDTAFFDGIFSAYSPEKDATLPEENPDDDTVIIYTSGTTGSIKGACLSNRAVISNIYYKEMSLEGNNVALNVLPMHHIFCFSCDYLKNVLDGVIICLNGDISNIGKNLLRYEPTCMRVVPMILASLVKKVAVIRKKNPELTARQAADQVFGRRLDFIIVSGAAFSDEVAKQLDEMGIVVRQGYGMTETGPRIAVADVKCSPMSGGRVISTVDIRLSDVGEIQVLSPSLLTCYYKKPEETEALFTEDGWLKTGDIGRLTPDRELFITGRLKNIIILSNGENVSPEEIEKAISRNGIVKEIVVYGKRDMIYADIFPDEEYAAAHDIADAEAEVRNVVNEYNLHCEPTKVIGTTVVTKEPLPRTSTGKIIRTGR